jgi:hypothetical protein
VCVVVVVVVVVVLGFEVRTSHAIARQALYYLNHKLPDFFYFSYFSGKMLDFCWEPASDLNSPNYVSQVAGITGMYHHAWLIFLTQCLANFYPGWPQILIIPISTS